MELRNSLSLSPSDRPKAAAMSLAGPVHGQIVDIFESGLAVETVRIVKPGRFYLFESHEDTRTMRFSGTVLRSKLSSRVQDARGRYVPSYRVAIELADGWTDSMRRFILGH